MDSINILKSDIDKKIENAQNSKAYYNFAFNDEDKLKKEMEMHDMIKKNIDNLNNPFPATSISESSTDVTTGNSIN